METLQKVLNKHLNLEVEEWLCFKGCLKEEVCKATTILVKENTIASKIYYIKSGLLRTFYFQEGKEITTYFACDHQFITPYASFIRQTPSLERLETIEESQLYSLSYSHLNNLYAQYPTFEKLGKILAEMNYLCLLNRSLSMQTKSAKEKYLDFMQSYDPKIIQRAPQYQIASFLGMAPESLSRIRKEIIIS